MATPDGKKMLRTSRVAAFNEADALKVGRDAGNELKAQGGTKFFLN